MPEFGHDIEIIRATALRTVNHQVTETRRKYITELLGQEMIYLDKEAEAKRYLAAAPEPTSMTEYPWINREIGLTGSTAYEVAQIFMNMAAVWRQVGPAIEGLRLEAKASISAATTTGEIDAAMDALITGLAPYA